MRERHQDDRGWLSIDALNEQVIEVRVGGSLSPELGAAFPRFARQAAARAERCSVFLDVREVHCLELKTLREWFLPNAKTYPLKATKTRTGANLYTTVGAIVPLRDVKSAVPAALTTHRFALTVAG